ncbi:MAG: radical SAM protein [Candidatus Omnitrophica bacterium]|nr:radical SAM protein [Candidatus Omnitrophota bacterium]
MIRLKEVIVSITNLCNSSCRMCDIPREKNEELSSSQWKEVIKDAQSIGASTIVFSGGEPLLRKDIFELISFVKGNGMTACITSNGLLIDEENASKLAAAGIDVVNISIEGPKDTHDYLRGRGSFEKAISACKNLKRYNIETTLATVVSRYNYRYLDYIVKLASEHGATTVKFQPFNPLFIRNKAREADFLLSKKEGMELSNKIKDIISLCAKHGISTNPSSYLEKVPDYLTKNFFDSNGGCNALWASCPITSKGEVYPCWVLSGRDKLIGSVKKKRLTEIWGSKRHDLMRRRIKKEGCPVCMMSCYDENFGREDLDKKIALNVQRLKKEGVREYTNRILRKLARGFKFYSTYRGGPRQIMHRVRGVFRRKKPPMLMRDNQEIEKALREVESVKKMVKKEMRPF